MNAGNLRGLGTQFDIQKKSAVAASSMVIGSYGPPIGPGTWTGATSNPAFNAVNPGNVTFDAPRFCSTGAYTHTLSPGATFYGSWILNDTIEFVGNTLSSLECGGLYVRPEIHCNDGQGGQTVVGQDIVLTVKGKNTPSQIVTFGPGSIILTNATNAYGVRPSIQTPDGLAITLGTVTLFQGVSLKGNMATYNTFIGLDLSLINSAAATTAWGIQVGTAQNYFAGNSTFGATSAPSFPVDVVGVARVQQGGTALLGGTAVPTATTNGITLNSAPLITSNGTYTLSGGNTWTPWLVNDTITVSASTSAIYALAVYPKITSSSGIGINAAGVEVSPTYAGTDTYSNMYGLSLNASIAAAATAVYGVNSVLVQQSATTATTVTVFNGQTLRTSGTWTTLIGLSLTSLSGGSTTWGMQIGNYQSYHQGPLTVGGTTAPTWNVHVQGGSSAKTAVGIDMSSTTPTNPASNGSIVLSAYAGSGGTNKYIMFTVNDGGTQRFIYTNYHSASGTVTWTAATSPPT